MAKDSKDEWVDVPLADDEWVDVPMTPQRESVSPAYSAAAGLSQGTTLGFGDEISGLANASFDQVMGEPGTFIEKYRKWRDLSRRGNAMAEKDNPKTYMAADIGGSLASPVNILGAPVKGASVAGNAARVLGTGALAGAGSSGTDATQSPEKLGDLAMESAGGAGINALAHGAGKPIGYLAKKLSPANLAASAEQRAVKAAIGQNKRAFKELNKSGQLQKAGRDLLDNDLVGWASNAEDILPRVSARKEEVGKKIGSIGSKIDELAPKSIPPQEIAEKLKEKLNSLPITEDTKKARNYLQSQIETYENMGVKEGGLGEKYWSRDANPLSFEDVQKNKDVIKWNAMEDPNRMDAGNATKRILGEAQENAASKLESNPEISKEVRDTLGQYKKLKSEYGPMKKLEDFGKERADANMSNRFFSPTDYASLGLGTVGGAAYGAASGQGSFEGALKGAALGAGHKALRTRGSAFAAKSMDKLSKILAADPAGLNQFRGVVERAAQKGPQALAVTHQLLSDNPEYRKLLEVEND